MSAPERQDIDPEQQQPALIRYDTLPPERLEHIRAVYEAAAELQRSGE